MNDTPHKEKNESAVNLGRLGGQKRFEKHGREAMVAMAMRSAEVRRAKKQIEEGKQTTT